MNKVLWTGGFDSTLRMLQLSYLDTDIQPYYIYYNGRLSADKERRTIDKITRMLNERSTTQAKILPLIVVDAEELFPIDQDISDAFDSVVSRENIVIQNKLLAQMCRKVSGLQVSYERVDEENAQFTDDVKSRPYLDRFEEEEEVYYQVNKTAPEDIYTLFKDYVFPERIITLTKQEELEEYQALDAMDIAKATWFCQNPWGNEPCGYCKVCRNTISELGTWRLTEAGKKRYKHWRFYLMMHKIKKGLRFLFQGKILQAFNLKKKY